MPGLNMKRRFAIAAAALGALGSQAVAAPAFQTLYEFQSLDDGVGPNSKLAIDAKGNLYGTTLYGGGGGGTCPTRSQCGSVYRLSPPEEPGGTWIKTILTNFPTPDIQGRFPTGVISTSAGELIGFAGGKPDTLFRLDPTAEGPWQLKVLYTRAPASGLPLRGPNRVIYGVGEGVVQFTPPATVGGAWSAATLHSFYTGDEGELPSSGVIKDVTGAFYGTLSPDFSHGCPQSDTVNSCGSIYKLTPPATQGGAWTATILHRFKSKTGGRMPMSELVMDKAGNLYGTTEYGGDLSANPGYGLGVVFRLSPPVTASGTWTYKVLHAFKGGSTDGAIPLGVTLAPSGVLYGVTVGGGGECTSSNGCGVAYELKPPAAGKTNWKQTILHHFTGANAHPSACLTLKSGVLYGTTVGHQNGYHFGEGATVFSLRP